MPTAQKMKIVVNRNGNMQAQRCIPVQGCAFEEDDYKYIAQEIGTMYTEL